MSKPTKEETENALRNALQTDAAIHEADLPEFMAEYFDLQDKEGVLLNEIAKIKGSLKLNRLRQEAVMHEIRTLSTSPQQRMRLI